MQVVLLLHTTPATINTHAHAQTYQYAEQESEQLKCRADVGEVGLLCLHSHQDLVEPGELELRVGPDVGPQGVLEERHTTSRQQLARRTHARRRVAVLWGVMQKGGRGNVSE